MGGVIEAAAQHLPSLNLSSGASGCILTFFSRVIYSMDHSGTKRTTRILVSYSL